MESRAVTTAAVGRLSDHPVGSLHTVTVGNHRILLVRTFSGMHALDSTCPHRDYDLATGSFDGEVVTCWWHDWKFRARDGKCVQGLRDVPSHRVDVIGDVIHVTVVDPVASRM